MKDSDKEKLLGMFKNAKIDFELSDRFNEVETKTRGNNIEGHTGFKAIFKFDRDDKLEKIAIWESY